MSEPRWSIAPYFIVDDVVATANFYRDVLGFSYDQIWNDPPSFCIVHRNGAAFSLSKLEITGVMRPNRIVDPEGCAWDAYVWVDDAKAVYEEFRSRGAKIVRELGNREYGCRDFDVEDCNGYRLGFGQELEDE